MHGRPTNREIHKKVTDARDAIAAGNFQFGPTKHIAGDLEELQLDSAGELPGIMAILLEEILEAGPDMCYAGGYPPQRSYESEIRNLELWAYSWHSHRFQKRMYLKFALKKECYIYVDCHEDRPPKG